MQESKAGQSQGQVLGSASENAWLPGARGGERSKCPLQARWAEMVAHNRRTEIRGIHCSPLDRS